MAPLATFTQLIATGIHITAMMESDRLTEFLLARLNIHVSGACGPKRDQPIECYYPSLHPYQHGRATVRSVRLSGAPRNIESSAAGDGVTTVYDRDIITTWRLPSTMAAYDVFFWEKAFECALAQETMLIAVEAFLEHEAEIPDWRNPSSLLEQFAAYVTTLGTQPVTITISSVVDDMVDFYASKSSWSAPSAWKENLKACIESFVHSRECFFRHLGRAPFVEATFAQPKLMPSGVELDVEVYYSWSLPTLEFYDLRNIVIEGQTFIIQPSLSAFQPHDSLMPITAEYFVGPADEWLHWNDDRVCFSGTVPRYIASCAGVERCDSYTIPLEMTARVTQHFPGLIGLERVIRCGFPLTVKRHPDGCARDIELPVSPRIPRPATSLFTGEERAAEDFSATLIKARSLKCLLPTMRASVPERAPKRRNPPYEKLLVSKESGLPGLKILKPNFSGNENVLSKLVPGTQISFTAHDLRQTVNVQASQPASTLPYDGDRITSSDGYRSLIDSYGSNGRGVSGVVNSDKELRHYASPLTSWPTARRCENATTDDMLALERESYKDSEENANAGVLDQWVDTVVASGSRGEQRESDETVSRTLLGSEKDGSYSSSREPHDMPVNGNHNEMRSPLRQLRQVRVHARHDSGKWFPAFVSPRPVRPKRDTRGWQEEIQRNFAEFEEAKKKQEMLDGQDVCMLDVLSDEENVSPSSRDEVAAERGV